MASAQAQAFFDKQSAKDRMAIIDSWGGRDLTDEWYNNAKAAGSVSEAPAAAPAASAAPTIEQLKAASVGKSEDFGRFQAGDAERWGAYYDAAASQAAGRPQFRSSRGAPGFFDKPTECPNGQSPAGPDETSPCKSTDALLAAQGAGQGGGQGAAGAAAAEPAYFGQDDPLQRMLTNQMASAGGSFAGTTSGGQFAGGGVFSEGAGQYGKPATTGTANPAATAALAALAPAAPVAAPVAAPAPEVGGMPLAAIRGNEAAKAAREAAAAGSTITAPAHIQFAAPAAPAAPTADAFGMAPATGSLDDLVNPRRAKRDARMGGSWF